MKRIAIAAAAIGALVLAATPLRAAEADVTGLVPTLRVSFDGQSVANTGSGRLESVKDDSTTPTFVASPNGYAIDTSVYTPYGEISSVFQTNHDKSIAALATLGATSTGIMFCFRKDSNSIILRRGTDAGSVVLTQNDTATPLISVQNADASDSAYHLYVVNILQDRVDLYIDAKLVGTTGTTPWSRAGEKYQFGSRSGGCKAGEAKYGGLIDDLRVYSDALSVPQMIQLAGSLNFPLADCLTVASTLEGCGAPSPAYGVTNGLAAGQTIAVSCGTTPWTNDTETASYSCTGWKLYDDAGNVVSNGTETSFAYTHPNPAASRRLEWQWAVNEVRGTITAESGGSVSPSGTAMYVGGTPIIVTATPDAGNAFSSWTGTSLPDGIDATSASVTFTPTAPFDMTATFVTAFDFYVAMPANGGDDGNAGTSPAAPFATIGAAVTAAKTALVGGNGLATIHVAAGMYEETGFVLDGPIAVIGETGDPTDVEIVDRVNGSRAFTLSHPLARVSNLTVSGTGYNDNGGSGGHVLMSDGTVENCIITNGRVGNSYPHSARGGNVCMSGGRLLRCQVLNGSVAWRDYFSEWSYGGGIYASGGLVDSCLVKDNSCGQKSRCGGVYADGTAKVVNCTIVGNSPTSVQYGDTVNGGVYVGSADATVANCVVYGNGDNSARANFGDANLDRFFSCGSSVANDSCATWKVLTNDDFVQFSEGNLRPVADSVLVDAGDVACRDAGGATRDLDGNDRVSGRSVDIGCYELDQSTLAPGGYVSSYAVLEASNVTFHAAALGQASDLKFRWDFGNGAMADTREAAYAYAYPTSGLFTVRLAASPDGGSTWTGWYTVPTLVVVAPELMFVDPSCATPAFPYKTKATASTTLAAALSSLTNNLSDGATCVDGVEVRIVAGSTLEESGLRLASAVAVVGETGDPRDVEILDRVSGHRAFTLSHPLARVADLTVSGTGYSSDGGCGGHVWMSDGTVENCIIAGGRIGYSHPKAAHGGNVFMSGGRLLRCQVLNGQTAWNAYHSEWSYGGGVYASGGLVDSCLVTNNVGRQRSRCGGVYAAGTAKVVNCTIFGNSPTSNQYGDQVNGGVYVGSADATVANCVVYGNGDGSARANFGDANLDRFFNCGSSVTNENCATWMVLTDNDFVDFAGGNLRQTRTSKIIDRGTLDTACRPADGATLDLDGNPRLIGRRIDLGCWEVASGVPTVIVVR